MNQTTIDLAALVHALGLDSWLPVLLAINTLCRALDAAIPQPAPGSHWIPARKVLTWLALGVLNAAPAGQPTMVTWMSRVIASQPTPSAPNPTPAPVQERRAAPFPPPITLRPPEITIRPPADRPS